MTGRSDENYVKIESSGSSIIIHVGYVIIDCLRERFNKVESISNWKIYI